jgi:hypothetical protein
MIYITKKNKCWWCTVIVFLLGLMIPAAKGTKLPIDLAQELKNHGYQTDTPEQIIEASKSESYYVRFIALELLTQRTGQKAIPTLKEALNDPRVEVRWRAAHWLGTLGDKSGLEQMRRDLKELAPTNGAPVACDPNVVEDPEEREQREGKRNRCLSDALDVAKVLAELGDRRGYELAARMALEGTMSALRYRGVAVLVEIAKTDEVILQAEGINPVSVLCEVAESEEDITVLRTLTGFVATQLDDTVAIRIIEIVKDSPNKSEEARWTAQVHLEMVKARKKGVGSTDCNSCE